jgi:maltoporin
MYLDAQLLSLYPNLTMGSYGRVGVGLSPTGEGNEGKPFNLSGQGSLGGRLEQYDYVDLMPALEFLPKIRGVTTTTVTYYARLSLYSDNGQFMGNVSTRSKLGLTIMFPENYIEASHILGSPWSVWAGSRYRRYEDVQIADYFYFDNHSAQGFGIIYKNSELDMFMPASTDSLGAIPYNYSVTVAGATNLAIRQRMVWVWEHKFHFKNDGMLKALVEFHHVAAASTNANVVYPSDNGWVAGLKYISPLRTIIPGSFNQISLRFGQGIANGGDNGNTFTWATYGPPDEYGKYTYANSITAVEHFLLNSSRNFSLNGYGVFTKSKGGSASTNMASYFTGAEMFNRKTDFAVGFRTIYYATNWLHLIGETHYALRKDGDNPNAEMLKFSFVPTLVPLGVRDPWSRPHIRLVFTVVHYNDYARDNHYSPYLMINKKTWGTYIGVKTEWWIL